MVFSSALCLRKIHLSRNKNTKSTKCKIHSKDKFKSQVEGKQRTKASSAPSAPSAATIKNAKASHTHCQSAATLGIRVSSNMPEQTDENMATAQPREPC